MNCEEILVVDDGNSACFHYNTSPSQEISDESLGILPTTSSQSEGDTIEVAVTHDVDLTINQNEM